jgi:hypothetical protein
MRMVAGISPMGWLLIFGLDSGFRGRTAGQKEWEYDLKFYWTFKTHG